MLYQIPSTDLQKFHGFHNDSHFLKDIVDPTNNTFILQLAKGRKKGYFRFCHLCMNGLKILITTLNMIGYLILLDQFK